MSCKQLSFLLQSGIPLSEVLRMMIGESKTPSQALFFREIVHSIDAGFRFSDSLERWGEGLPRFFIQSVRAGEFSGEWDTIFRDLSDFYQKEYLRLQQRKQAMYYPALLLLVTGVVCYFLMSIIVPNFLFLYVNGQGLPWPTKLLLQGYQNRNLILLSLTIGIILLVFLIPRILTLPKIQIPWSRFLLKIPSLGTFLIKQDLIRFCHTFSLLLAHGLEINSALPVSTELINSAYLRHCLNAVTQEIEKGSGFSSAMNDMNFLPTSFIRMLQIGETGNRLQETLKDVSTLYELEMNSQIQSWQRMIEPVLIILISFMVGFLAFAVLLPMMDQWQGYQIL